MVASIVTRIEAGMEVPRAMANFPLQLSQVGHSWLPSGPSVGQIGEEEGEIEMEMEGEGVGEYTGDVAEAEEEAMVGEEREVVVGVVESEVKEEEAIAVEETGIMVGETDSS